MSKSNRTVSRLPMATSFYGYEPVQGMVPLSFGSGVPYSDAYVIVFFDIRLLYRPSTTISYLANTDGTQTALVASWQNGSDIAYTYQYDANGNITQIAQGSASVTYAYDAANQLIRENNGFTNQTVTYEYDSWGNILNKKTYAYTTGDLGIPTTTDTYTYGNESWGIS